jgi:hypothetical protein
VPNRRLIRLELPEAPAPQSAYAEADRRQAVADILKENRFDPADVRTDRSFTDDLHGTNIAERLHVCATTQFGGMRTSFKNLDDIAVLVAEERNGAYFFGFVFRRFVMTSRRVGENVRRNEVFDGNDFVVTQSFVMREIETKSIGTDE